MKAVGKIFSNFGWGRILVLNLIVVLLIGCEKEPINFAEDANLSVKKTFSAESYEFSAPIFDIASSPDGSILLGLNNGDKRSIQVIKNGKIRTMAEMDVATNINGIAAIGAGNAFVTTAGSDLAKDGELYRVSYGSVRMVADLAAFEQNNDPDAFAGPQWKNQLCEFDPPLFSPGPQNNPYKVEAVNGGLALVADAAGNTLLSATTSGEVALKALFTPPVDENGDWMILFNIPEGETEEIPCYVQPVPTSVAVGPDGYIYVGELTGAVADGIPVGLSRVWKIPADAEGAVCSTETDDCQLLINGLTSVIDIAIGPDGLLYVVEFDEGSWFASFIPGLIQGGTINIYSLDGEFLGEVPGEFSFPSAIAFDNKGYLWVLENNAVGGLIPTVRMVDYQVQ